MKTTLDRLRRFTDHPITRIVMGMILVISAIAEGYDTFFDDMRHFRLRAHHGLLIFGLANVLASVPDLIEGLDSAADALTAGDDAPAEG